MNILAIEIGGSKIRIGRSSGRKITHLAIFPTPKTWPSAKVRFVEAAGKMFAGRKIDRVVAGFPGQFDLLRSKLVFAPNIRPWVGQPILEDLRRLFLAPVTLENDAALCAAGEAVQGAGKGRVIVAYVAVGTGVGGARVVNGQIDATAHGFEPGHQIVQFRKTLEQTIGGRYLARQYGRRWPKKLTLAEWNEIADWIAIGLNNIIRLWSPDIIVLGGTVVMKGRIPVSSLRMRLSRLPVPPVFIPPIVKARLGERAGLTGAVMLARKPKGKGV